MSESSEFRFGRTCKRCGGEMGVDFPVMMTTSDDDCRNRHNRPDGCVVCGTLFYRLTQERIRHGVVIVEGGRMVRWAGKRIYAHKKAHYQFGEISTDFPQAAEK